MRRLGHKGRIDANQRATVKELRAVPGVTVAVTATLGDGFPDIIVGYRKRNYLIELKDGDKPPSARKLTDDEQRFFDEWRGQVDVCESFDDVLQVIGVT